MKATVAAFLSVLMSGCSVFDMTERPFTIPSTAADTDESVGSDQDTYPSFVTPLEGLPE